ncbi:hypothetical protein [Paludisphaera borealis]|uniref:Uncharacterized protein n=1 Tax=Paludisphaera borealis TaxID=1387353 RepID=A0A1U7CXM3_9BACT|nr:hypothetical protein [Paludisphaera borealis]APW63697.1 hypothetical protein BSF38_05271 [Paludisphaera borealis]
MADSHHTRRFTSQLLQQDESLSDSQYKDYRMNLENALTAAERKEQLAAYVGAASFAVALMLMFVGGSAILGDFDPWSKNANPLSVTVGVIYCLASVTWPLALAVGFSRFRPAVGAAKERLRDAMILDLQREIRALRRQIAPASPDEPDQGKPHAD